VGEALALSVGEGVAEELGDAPGVALRDGEGEPVGLEDKTGDALNVGDGVTAELEDAVSDAVRVADVLGDAPTGRLPVGDALSVEVCVAVPVCEPAGLRVLVGEVVLVLDTGAAPIRRTRWLALSA